MASISDLKRVWLLTQLGLPVDSTLSEADLEIAFYSNAGSSIAGYIVVETTEDVPEGLPADRLVIVKATV